MNILNLYKNFYDGEASDIFISDEFVGARELSQKLRDLNIFQNVYFFEYYKGKGKLKETADVLFSKNSIFREHEPLKEYDTFFVYGRNYLAWSIFSQLKKKNSKLNLYYIEDGIAAYVDKNIYQTKSYKKKIIGLLNKWAIFHFEIEKYFVYNPGLSVFPEEKKIELPALEENNSALSVIQSLFILPKSLTIKNSIVFLDQPFVADGYSFSEFEIFQEIKAILPNDKKIIVKLHPRSEKNKYGLDVEYFRTDTPFELLVLADIFKDSLVINPLSTGTFSSDFMFHKKVQTVFLSNLLTNENGFEVKGISEQSVVNFNVFLNKYMSVEKKLSFFLPENFKELRRILQNF